MNLFRVSGPEQSALDLNTAKLWLRVTHTVEDALIQTLLETVRDRAEAYGICLDTSTWDLRMERFPPVIRLPRAPVLGVSSITYLDADGASQTLATSEYQTDIYSWPARIQPAFGKSWPVTRLVQNAVRVRFTAGYDVTGATPDVPPLLLGALRMALWDAYWCRGDHEAIEGALERAFGRYQLYV